MHFHAFMLPATIDQPARAMTRNGRVDMALCHRIKCAGDAWKGASSRPDVDGVTGAVNVYANTPLRPAAPACRFSDAAHTAAATG